MKSMLVIENYWTDVIYSFDWYGLSPFTIHTGLSGEDLELRHTVFWCIYPSSRGDLFIRGTNYFFVIFLMIWYFVSFFDFFKSQTITSISCIFRPYLVSLTKDNEICYNVINNFTRKKYYRDYVIEEYTTTTSGSTGDSNLCVYGTSETRNGRPETEEVPDVQERKWLLLSLSIGGKSDVTQKGLVRELVEFNH